MRVLIVRKSTNFERHGDRVRHSISAGYRPESDWDSLKIAHDQHYHTLDQLLLRLNEAGIAHDGIMRDESWPSDFYDYIITVGGDGTLLSASHAIDQVESDGVSKVSKLLGIRSSDASVGYTCAIDRHGIESLVRHLANGTLGFCRVSRLAVAIEHLGQRQQTKSFPILNDVLFTNINPAATSQYILRVGEFQEFQKSSGIWISTAVGSTAAILAAGGFSLSIEDRRFQYRVRELYKAGDQLPTIEGAAFNADETKLSMENRSERALVALDGQHGAVTLDYGDRVTISRSSDLLLARPFRATNG